MIKCKYALLIHGSCLGIISLFIGLLLFFTSCNPDIKDNCEPNKFLMLKLYNKTKFDDICERCTRGGWTGGSYTCRDEKCTKMELTFVYLDNDINEVKCVKNSEYNPKYYDKYVYNETYKILVGENMECIYDINNLKVRWIVGITFICLTVVFSICVLVSIYNIFCKT